jgi:hypothetical protein
MGIRFFTLINKVIIYNIYRLFNEVIYSGGLKEIYGIEGIRLHTVIVISLTQSLILFLFCLQGLLTLLSNYIIPAPLFLLLTICVFVINYRYLISKRRLVRIVLEQPVIMNKVLSICITLLYLIIAFSILFT